MATKQEQVDQPNLVSSRGFLVSARDLGLTTSDAVCELVDNSLDAGANNIRIHVAKAGDHLEIRVLDDGAGIPPEVRGEDGRLKDGIGFALSFGGRVPGRATGATIGKFGWGLSSAACCQSLRTDVYTKQKGETKPRYNCLDLEALEATNSIQLPRTTFESPEGPLSEEFVRSDSGTLIILAKCDNPDFKTVKKMAEALESHLGMKYRRFLGAGRSIQVNDGKSLLPRDPLFLTPGCFDSDKIPLAEPYTEIDPLVFEDVRDAAGQPARVTIRVVCLDVDRIRRLPEWNPRWMTERGLNEENQGFYLMRNERQIAEAQTLNLFTRNADLNYFRGEISFPPALDRFFGIQTNKSRFTLKETMKERIEKALGPVIGHINNETRAKIEKIKADKAIAEAEKMGPTPAEQIAAEGAKVLKVRPGSVGAEVLKELERIDQEEAAEIAKVESTPGLDSETKAEQVQLIQVRFETARLPYRVVFDVLGDGNFYDPKFRGRQAQVIVNREHPFFAVYERATQAPEQRILLDLLLQSAVHAEGMYEGNREMIAAIEQFRREWSIALKVFLDRKDEIAEEAEGRREAADAS
jgi:hypothetical protein